MDEMDLWHVYCYALTWGWVELTFSRKYFSVGYGNRKIVRITMIRPCEVSNGSRLYIHFYLYALFSSISMSSPETKMVMYCVSNILW